ncbi:MAG: hydrogen peroxide-inducible genes activator [Porphyromonas sp.]|nr:hydrogen peroxide-inducible genes activator [Porphyromonas sp.]
MTLQQLEYILALSKHRHFAKAASDCDVTQPTLSTMIQKLESELGVKLFDRNRGGIQPTLIGEKVIAQAEIVVGESAKISELVAEEKDSLKGNLRLAVLPTIAPFLLPRLRDGLFKSLPKVNFEIKEEKTSQCLSSLLDNEIDVAIIASKAETEGLEERVLYFEEFFGYISEREPLYSMETIRSTEVDGGRLWLLDEGHCFRDQLVRFCQLKSYVNKPYNYSNGSLSTFMHMVESGDGMTFIPELAIETLSPEQRKLVRPFALPRPTRPIVLCYRESFVRRRILQEMERILRASVPQAMLELRMGQQLV